MLDNWNDKQLEAFHEIENQVLIFGFTPIQALTMGLSYFKGDYYDLNEKEFELIVKAFVNKYMQ
jgi:hypothetical protein